MVIVSKTTKNRFHQDKSTQFNYLPLEFTINTSLNWILLNTKSMLV